MCIRDRPKRDQLINTFKNIIPKTRSCGQGEVVILKSNLTRKLEYNHVLEEVDRSV